MTLFRIKLWYADGHLGEHEVHADEQDQAIAIAWSRVRKRGLLTLPMAYMKAEVLSATEGGSDSEG